MREANLGSLIAFAIIILTSYRGFFNESEILASCEQLESTVPLFPSAVALELPRKGGLP